MFEIERIVAEGLCTGCGLCAGLASEIEMQVAASGYERPVQAGDLSPDLSATLAHACPALHLRGLDQEDIDGATYFDAVWGSYERLVKAHASDPKVRHRASTGGVLTALAQYLLASEQVAFILQVKAGGRDPSFGQMQISSSLQEVLESAGSCYGPAAPLEQIGAVLDRGQPFAFVARVPAGKAQD